MPAHRRLFSLSHFIEEVRLSAALQAEMEHCHLDVAKVDPHLALDADRDLLLSAVGNLLQNAFKFTHRETDVSLSAYASADRILIDVEDHCGGLPAGDAEKMFLPFSRNSQNKTGLGLGLSIARSSVEANDGILGVSDRPGSGCIFRIDLPRFPMPDSFAPRQPSWLFNGG
ncbi:MAG: HAMP domain-containing sensor histidine kinase [Chthoniobacterales bacterium]